jgi:hypothetical protein
MKNSKCNITGFLFTFFILNSSLLVPDCMSKWMLAGNSPSGTCLALTANSNTIFAAALYNGIYKSTNNGTNWSSCLSVSASGYTLAANGNNIFAATYTNNIVYYSSNNGTNWIPTSLNDRTVISLAVKGDTVYAGAGTYGVYVSTNNGANWTQTSLNNQTVPSLAVKGDTVFAGTTTSGVYISTNSGTNWTQTSLNNQYIISLAISGNNIFAGRSGVGVLSIYLSTDNGATWTPTSLNSNSVWSLAISGNNIFAGTYGTGFYVSTDFGGSWMLRNEGLGGMFVRSLCISNNYIFACPDTRVYRRLLSDLTAIQSVSNEIPKQFSLSQNYPNPFNPVTSIEFRLPDRGSVKLRVYDVMGKEIQTLVKGEMNPGVYKTEWNAANYSSGVYFYTLVSGNFTETRKMVIAK